jgi:hypothetical protein
MAQQKETAQQTPNGHSNVRQNGKKPSAGQANGHLRSFDPARYLIQLPKREKVNLPDGQVSWRSSQVDYLPVAARIAWFRLEHPAWSIITKEVKRASKATVMKAIIKDEQGRVIATARKRESEASFSDYIEKAETGAIGRALAMCGYGTLQAPEFNEEQRLADAPVEKAKRPR